MSTSTSRLGLVMPAVGESMALGDDISSANYGKIDTAMGMQVLAGSPPAPFAGQLWDDTTTDQKKISDGATFKPFQKDTWQKGEVSRQTNASQLTTTSEFTLFNQNVPVVNGAKYLIRWSTFLKWDATFVAGGVYVIKVRVNAATVKTKALPDYGGRTVNLGGSFCGYFEYTAVATGNISLGLMLNGASGFGNAAMINPSGSLTNMSAERWAS